MKRKVLFLASLCLFVGIASGAIEKEPYLIYPGTNTEMMVLWQMDSTQNCTLDWGTSVSYGSSTVTTEYWDGAGTLQNQHKYTITGLTPGTKYFYRVDTGSYYTGTFYAAPAASATDVKFSVFADVRNHPERQHNVNGRMITDYTADSGYQSLLLCAGDWNDWGRDETSWTRDWFNTTHSNMMELRANMPVNGAMGNHELYPNATEPVEFVNDLYHKYFPFPYVGGGLTDPNRYWSFDYGPAHIVIVDQYSHSDGGDILDSQLTWIENDLTATSKDWKFLIMHYPGYTASDRTKSQVQTAIQPLCETYNVDIVFASHEHFYARCEVNGIQHITTGGGAANLDPVDPTKPYVVAAESDYHYCRVDIDGDLLTVEAVKIDGSIIDTAIIEHNGAPPVPDPMTWATVPYALSGHTIDMEATTATDAATGGVEYYFDCTAGGGGDSGWIVTDAYEPMGLLTSTMYTYAVKARDISTDRNETAFSSAKSATTFDGTLDWGYLVQSGRVQITGTTLDVPITAVSDMSRAFVLFSKGTGYASSVNENSDIVQVRGYLQAAGNVRIERTTSTESSWVSYQVIECLNEEFKAYRGSGSMTTSDLAKVETIGATVTSGDCLAYVTADSDTASVDYYNQGMLTARLTSSTQVTIEREASGNTAPNFNWVVVEFDPVKIASIQHGSVTATNATYASPQTAAISAVDLDTSIMVCQARAASNGQNQTAWAGNISSATEVRFHKFTDTADYADIEYYVIDFGVGADSQRGTVDNSVNGDWIEEDISIDRVNVSQAMSFHNITCQGVGAGFPRPMATAEFTSDTNLRIQRMRAAQPGYIEWQVLELPYFGGVGDLDGDYDVDINDLAKLAEYWLLSSGADINGDGDVDMEDFWMLAANWDH